MNPQETKDILRLVAALWTRHPLTEDTMDGWAVALAPISFEVARKAVIEHSRSERGEWPPTVAVIAAAARAADRERRPVSQVINDLHAWAAAATQTDEVNRRRLTAAQAKVGPERWRELLDIARTQLQAEYGHHIIPARLIGKRAVELVNQNG